ncbi:glycosyl transferase family 39 [Stanieria cyanosphaera PCC 7437]|uniref:Glycosyl transferase family 39 n=1 Tax=Stanieria cyanosphaera (strain ATCC 29371 / PCC 7437) TaxID=111780 RepID=K9Y0L9_STAC7|nr:glycosyltransferase family 39 protein [Stanieria cyanosphaera]AFZ37849.1 glycosyl transferase family 39 [Stanieria cyanosphaera PCC 7437]
MSSHQTSLWKRSQNKLRQEEQWLEYFCIVGLLLASLLLFSINLGSLPLLDGDESTIAQVAKEIWQAPENSWRWLFPTLWNQPYLNQPPLIHNLIAGVYAIAGINEWTVRFPCALLTAISVILLYGIGREIFVARIPALFSALIYLTLLPIVHYGRLAVLDGPLLCFQLLTFWSILRARRDLRWTFIAGISFSLICLTQGIIGLLVGLIVLIFLAWDTPRLITSIYLWSGIILGSIPVLFWYVAQWHYYQDLVFDWKSIIQSWARIWSVVESNPKFPGYYFVEILKFTWPWLIFAIYGWKLAWENRHWGWAKLILVWSGVYFVAISLMATKLPWYILPIYPALALAAGIKLYQIYNLPSYIVYPRPLIVVLSLFAFIASGTGIYVIWQEKLELSLLLICASVAITMTVTALLIAKREVQFIFLLFWGTYISLFLLVSSSHWLWELNQAYPVKPVAQIIKQYVPKNQIVYTSFSYNRSSLNFYSERQVVAVTQNQLQQYWQELANSYMLIDHSTLEYLSIPKQNLVPVINDQSVDWFLAIKNLK